MKKPYQIEAQRAVKQFEAMAADGNPAVQMVLPMAEMVGWLRKGVGALIRQAGLQLMDLIMQEEVRELAGKRSEQQPERTANRWGSERGYCVVMGQKVPIQRPRVRTIDDKEVRLGSYEMFHRGEPLTETVWEKLMLGLSTRKYGEAVRQFTEAYGLEKSAVSEHFIEASRAKLKQLMERRLEKMQFCALLIDATPFEGQQMVAALGIGQDGRKTILGLRQGATENATVVGELMDFNPSAARSLAEGMEETLTVHKLQVPAQLRQTLASTNVIESAFSVVEKVCANVKRWHPGDQRERWVGSGLLVAEKQFRRVQGHKQIPILLRELETLFPSKSEVVKRKKAS